MADEMEGLWMGPMPVTAFLQEFLPECEHSLPTFETDPFGWLGGKTGGNNTCAPFMIDNRLVPGYKVIDTSNHPDLKSRAGGNIKPDLAVYDENLPLKHGTTRFDELELNFKVKPKSSQDPFRDPRGKTHSNTHRFTASTSSARRILGQLTSYATEWCSVQYRTFAFTVGIFGSYARFIRWDRSGAAVSERFNYRQNPHYLTTFLWRFVHLNPEDRGRDTTIRNASLEEALIAAQKLSKWSNKNKRSPVVFTIKDDGVDQEFIGLGSMADARSLTGRATRAYPVWDKKRGKLCFLKDSWREVTLEGEANIIRELNREGVRYVPTLVCGGDMEHTTKTHILAGNTGGSSTAWRCCSTDSGSALERIHHRFVVDFVGQSLFHFPSTYVLIKVILHAFIAHWEAYQKCQILHRDISIRNIMLDAEGNGILNDWDMAKHITPSSEIETVSCRELVGTWLFMSAPVLMCPTKQHGIQDDIESFVWVILYVLLHHTRHSVSPNKLQRIVSMIFETCRIESGVLTGGLPKQHLCFSPYFTLGYGFHVIGNAPLTCLIKELLQALAQWHQYVFSYFFPEPAGSNTGNTVFEEGQLQGTTDIPLSCQATRSLDPRSLQLYDHAGVYQLLVHTLAETTWPDGDKAISNFTT